MGMYTWLQDQEFKYCLKLTDKSANEVYQEARELFPLLYVQERMFNVGKTWFKKGKVITQYNVYVRTSMNDNEVRCMNLPFNNKELLVNFLFGLINGHHWSLENLKVKK